MMNMKKYRNTAALCLIVLTALTACHRYDADGYKFDNSIYLDVSSRSQLQPATFGNKASTMTKQLSATLTYPAGQEVTATIALDGSLVETYNHRYGTDYELLPDRYTTFTSSQVTIPAGRTTSEPVSIDFIGLDGEGENHEGAMEIDKTYLFPVRITSDNMEVMNSSSVAYYLVRRSSAITTAADLTDNWISFPLLDQPGPQADAYTGLSSVTMEALIYVDKFDLKNEFGACAISTIMGVEQYFLLRLGDVNFERQQLQFDGSAPGFGKFPKADPGKKIETGQWYHVAATYDSQERIVRIYVNGKIQSEGKEMGTLPDGGLNFAMRAQANATGDERQFFIGYSYNDFRPLQGMIAEARVWKVARTPQQIWDNMYRIMDPQSEEALIGYWKFDDGKGNVVKDYSRYGNDGVAHADLKWPDGVEIPEINKKEE